MRQYQCVKKPKTDTKKTNATNLNNNEPSSNDDKLEVSSWYQNNSLNDEISNSDEEKNDISGYDSESDLEPKLSLPSNLSMTQSTTFK